MSVTFRPIATREERERWNALAGTSPAGHRHQCLWWMEPLQRYGFRVSALGCWNGDRLVGGALFRSYTVPLGLVTVTECLDGPVFLEWDDGWAEAFVAAMADLARGIGSATVSIQDCPRGEIQRSIAAALERAGHKTILKPGASDAVLPLRGRTMEEIWKGFNHGTRRRIKKGRSELAVRRLTEPEELAQAYAAWIATASRKSFSDVRPWATLEPVVRPCVLQGLGSVLGSFLDDKLLAAVFITHIGDTAYYVYGGYVDGAEKQSPTHVLHDEAIRESREKGLIGYNFGSLLGPAQPHARGVDEFKLGFGAIPRPHQDTLIWVRKPVLHASMDRVRRGWLGRNLEARVRQVLIRRGQRDGRVEVGVNR
jgi:hypothetical protein